MLIDTGTQNRHTWSHHRCKDRHTQKFTQTQVYTDIGIKKYTTHAKRHTNIDTHSKAYLCRHSSKHTDLPTIKIVKDSYKESSMQRHGGARHEQRDTFKN